MRNYTKDAIKASFLKLLSEQPLSKISVRSIVEDCGINRNSFYYHFQDIPALIEEIVKDNCDALVAHYPAVSSLRECVDVALRFAVENKRAVLHLFQSANRDIYERYSMQLCEYLVTTYLDTAFGRDAIPAYDRALAIRFFKCTVYGLCYDWITDGMRDERIRDMDYLTQLCRGLSDELIRRSREAAAVQAGRASPCRPDFPGSSGADAPCTPETN